MRNNLKNMPELTTDFIKESVDIIDSEFKGVEDYHLALRIELMLSIDSDLFHLKKLNKELENIKDKSKKEEIEKLSEFVLYNIDYKRKVIDELISRSEIKKESC